MAISEADLRRILTTEERNVLVMCGRARGADELRLAARSLNLTPQRVQVILGGARTKIERETRKGGRGVPTAIEEVKCGCGQEFTPRRKGQLLCPACVELNGDGRPLIEPHRSNGWSDHREPDHEPDHESAQLDRPEASPDEAPDNGDVARNPPPARSFMRDDDVQARRARIIAALTESVEDELTPRAIATATGLDMPTTQNDLMRLTKQGTLVRRKLAHNRTAYRLPGDEGSAVQNDGTAEPPFEWPDPPRGWRYTDEPGDDGRRTIERIDGDGVGSISEDGHSIEFRPADPEPAVESATEAATEEQPDEQIVKHANVGQSISEEGRRAVEAAISAPDGEMSGTVSPPDAHVPAAAADIKLDTPEKIAGAKRFLREVERSKRQAALLAGELYDEAVAYAEALDAAIPETLLRARYIAALLGRIEAGDTSPDLLDRFERLAFD